MLLFAAPRSGSSPATWPPLQPRAGEAPHRHGLLCSPAQRKLPISLPLYAAPAPHAAEAPYQSASICSPGSPRSGSSPPGCFYMQPRHPAQRKLPYCQPASVCSPAHRKLPISLPASAAETPLSTCFSLQLHCLAEIPNGPATHRLQPGPCSGCSPFLPFLTAPCSRINSPSGCLSLRPRAAEAPLLQHVSPCSRTTQRRFASNDLPRTGSSLQIHSSISQDGSHRNSSHNPGRSGGRQTTSAVTPCHSASAGCPSLLVASGRLAPRVASRAPSAFL